MTRSACLEWISASKHWRDIGSATVALGDGYASAAVACSAIEWPASTSMSPRGLGEVIDEFARTHEIAAISLDGPHGWRDPCASGSQGVGRAAERSSATPGKTGCFGTTFPATYVGWTSFCIAVFDHLLSLEHVRLANDVRACRLDRPAPGNYYVLECFPTVTWRTSGLVPLPGKGKHPDTAPFADALAARWGLRGIEVGVGHDDLQAVVAALVAASLFGCGVPIAHGIPASTLSAREGSADHRVEGLIWDARPPEIQEAGDANGLAQSKSQRYSTRRRGDLPPKPLNRALGSATMLGYDFERAKPFISAIPCGRWSAYKDVATAAGNPDAYMAAGNDLRASNGTIDGYWRVIHSDGSIADGFVAHAVNLPRDPESARARLKSEGIRFDHRGRADKSQRFRYQDWVESR